MLIDEVARRVLPLTRFDGLCLDARDATRQAEFWRLALRGSMRTLPGGRLRVDPGPSRPRNEIVRVNPVTAPGPEHSRVHVDLCLPGREPRELLDAGAQIVRTPGADPWYVLTDPEGSEFCAYPSVDDRPPGIFELVVKCRDAHDLARWWGRVLGGQVAIEGEAAVLTGTPDFPWDFMVFDPVPEPKTAKNRWHWHVTMRESEPVELMTMGATLLKEPTADNGWVLADPEGNEFCAQKNAR